VPFFGLPRNISHVTLTKNGFWVTFRQFSATYKGTNMPKIIWKTTNYVTAYEFARQGLSDARIAESMGISKVTLRKWRKNRPAFKEAIVRGRGIVNGKSEITEYHEYIFGKLPLHLQELWEEITWAEVELNPIKRVEALLVDHGKRARQHLFIHALVASNFNVSASCSKVNISRKTFEHWVTNEPDFAELMDEMTWHKKNYFESALIRLVARGDTSAILFVNRTQNRDRGYNDKQVVEHQGTINHNHTVIQVDKLDLPLDVRRTILEAVRAQRHQEAIDGKVV